MKVTGIIVIKEGTEEPEGVGFINPEHPYLVIDPEQADDDTLEICRSIIQNSGYVPVGVVIDPEVDLDTP